jgi:hypothetical protein
MRSRFLLHLSLLLATCVLVGCGARTNVSATANVTSEYSHVWITVNDVKFNTSASAAPGASSWLDFPLSTPVTIDLATVTNGGLAVFGDSLNVPTGNYLQMQLLLSDPSASLTSSAATAGLVYNDQVQYLNSAGAAVTAPLDLVHPEQGIVLAVSLSVPSNLKAELEALDEGADTTADETEPGTTGETGVATGTTTGLGVATTPTCTPTTTDTTTTTATSTPITTTSDCTTTNTQFTVGIDFDAERDPRALHFQQSARLPAQSAPDGLRPLHGRHDSGHAQSVCAHESEYLRHDDDHDHDDHVHHDTHPPRPPAAIRPSK